MGQALTLKYLDEACPSIEPAAVELPITGEIGGVGVRGYVDLLDTSGRVIELKSAARKPSEVSPDHRFQVATYCALSPQVSGEARVDTLVKTKTPQLVEMPYTVQACDLTEIERMYPLVPRAIRTGLFLPNRSNYMCSRKYCAFWRACQNEFGGEVGNDEQVGRSKRSRRLRSVRRRGTTGGRRRGARRRRPEGRRRRARPRGAAPGAQKHPGHESYFFA
ncbi:MAG TPA: hypothetical protein VG096_02895 [Bryobacteraceae bacterium]|nr:hypothetical protein [Bryobacteraceae bacterium]